MIRTLFALAVLALLAVPAHAIGIRGTSIIDRDKVLVGDLFDVSGDAAQQPVGDAPAPGQSHTFDVYALQRVARAYDISWSSADLGVKSIVQRASTPVSNAQILTAVREALAEAQPQTKADDAEIVLDRRNLELQLPASVKNPSVSLVDMKFNSISHRFSGMLMVQGSDAGTEPQLIPLSGRAIPQMRVPVLTRAVSSGSTVSDADIEMAVMPVNKVVGDVLTDVRAFKGKELKRDMAAGAWLRNADLRPAQLVRRGNTVMVGIARGGLSITTRGRAMGDAGVGDTVRVMNVSTNRVVEGVVQADGSVAVTGI